MAKAKKEIVYLECTDLAKAKSAQLSTNPKEMLRLFERAVKNNPTNLLVLQEACLAYVSQYELRKAHACINRMISFAKQNQPQIFILAGQMNLAAHRREQALECFRKAEKLGVKQPNASLEIAGVLEKRGNYSASLEQVEKALFHSPNDGIALRLKAHLHHKLNEHDLSERIYSKLVTEKKCSLEIQAQALNGWAHLLDDQEQYSEAFDKILESKKLQCSQPIYQNIKDRYQVEYSRLRLLIDSMNADNVPKLKVDDQHLPTYLLTGCPRSGTTLIEKVLDAHTDIISADEYNVLTSYIIPNLLTKYNTKGPITMDSINLIPSSANRQAAVNYRKSIELAMGEKIGKRHFIDKNPGLTGLLPAVLGISSYTKIIYALRDPRDIMLSSLFRWLPLNTASLPFLKPETTAAHISQELNFWSKIRAVLPSKQWHETRYENSVENIKNEVSTLLKWMGLQWQENVTNYRQHLANRGVNSPTYGEVAMPIYTKSIQKWKHYEQPLEPYLEKLSNVIIENNYSP